MSTASASTSSFPTDEHPYLTLAKEIARKYVGMTYTLDSDPKVDFEFEVSGSLFTYGTQTYGHWTVYLKAEIDGLIYKVTHNGTTGEVAAVLEDIDGAIHDVTHKTQEKEPNG